MNDIVERLRHHIAIRGGPAKDDDGKYIGTTWPMMLDAADEIERLREAAADLQQTFDLQWEADMRAVKRWREAHPGNDLVLPDRANMVVWLMEQHGAALTSTERSVSPCDPNDPRPIWEQGLRTPSTDGGSK